MRIFMSSVIPRKGIVTSGNMKEVQKCKMQQLSSDKLQLNREVHYDISQHLGARKWVLAAKSLAHLKQICFPRSSYCECNCLKIYIIG